MILFIFLMNYSKERSRYWNGRKDGRILGLYTRCREIKCLVERKGMFF